MDLICIQETKYDKSCPEIYFALWGWNKIEWVETMGMNHVGGILIIWHKDKFQMSNHFFGMVI